MNQPVYSCRPLGNNWVRSKDGLIAGVCSGIAKQTDLPIWSIRLLWILAVLLFGTGFVAYLILAFSLPREDSVAEAYEKKVLGVCHRISVNTGMEVGLVRALAIFLGLASLGATLVGYVVLYFVVPEIEDQSMKLLKDEGVIQAKGI